MHLHISLVHFKFQLKKLNKMHDNNEKNFCKGSILKSHQKQKISMEIYKNMWELWTAIPAK